MSKPMKYLLRGGAVVLILLVLGTSFFFYKLFHRVEGKYFDSNGVRIHYVDEGSGEPVILIHGFAANVDANWRAPQVLDEIKKHHRVIALDNRGHGLSDKPHDPKQYGANMVEDVVRLMDHLKIDKAHIVGYSMGGFMTLKMLTLHPERFLSATIGGAGYQKTTPEDAAFFDALSTSLESGQGYDPLFVRLTPIGKPVNHRKIAYFNAMLSMVNDEAALAAVMRSFPEFIPEEAPLTTIAVPVLLVCGETDPLRTAVEGLVPLLPNEEVVWIKDGDHISALGKPAFCEAVHTFIDKHAMAK